MTVASLLHAKKTPTSACTSYRGSCSLVFAVSPLRDFAMRGAGNYWLVGMLCAGVLIAGSGITFVFVERPCIAIGKRFARRPHAPGAVRHASRVAPFAAAVLEQRQPAPTTGVDRQLRRRY
jgi:hypothetical protein